MINGMPRLGLLALASGLALGLAACGADNTEQGTDGSSAAEPSVSEQPALEGDVVVLAAASLTESFSQLGADFEAENPGVTVTFSFGASSALAQQVVSGAPGDLFASASPTTMATVTDAGLARGEPVVFVRNRLQIAVPAGNPGGVTGLADFADADLTIALCAEEVPCGAAAAKAFTSAGITPAPDTLEQDVKATLTKVELGEVDAALVYRTDVRAAGDTVEGINFPASGDAINDYPIVLLTESPNPDAGTAFIEYVQSDEGLAALEEAGFQLP